MAEWQNWAGNQRNDAVEVLVPRDEEELAAVVVAATEGGRRVKPIGAGHSFTAIGSPVDIQVSLDRISGIVRADATTGLVTVRGGTRLKVLNRALEALGLSMTNLGDIEEQSISGAISTGTHGTGARFGGLATQVRGLRLLLADGSVVSCSPAENPEIFDLARVGLGALGIIVEVTLQTEPLFALHAREGNGELAEVMASFEEHASGTDHFELYWFPHTTRVLTKHNTRRPLPETPLSPVGRVRGWFDDELLSNQALGATVGLGLRVPGLVRPLARFAASALSPREFTDISYRVFTSQRKVRFVESEYAVPRAAGMEVLGELQRAVEASSWNISFPVEVRVAAADDIPLSTGFERENVYIAIHTAPTSPWRADYFAAFERIATEAGGRPHWGKMHTLSASDLASRYPRLDDFITLRDKLDPTRTFTNPYLTQVLGS
ncbi:L-gulonolactone oxidase [Nocardioides luteus]|uniref:D-arabinono-1,4-lactone oxidase n=1 Tax=Nocardioides luteus TaxID=1844 RepID=UPI001668C67F|nr:D-arabinono-1,4-lactone oxidase [Nocardioides luteus]MDR7312818.1 L-gulonolactone oxidase [Nocardioides luteus]